MDSHGFSWFHYLHGVPAHVAGVIFVGVVLVALTWVARAQLAQIMQTADGGLIPEPKLTYRNFFEIIAEKLYALVESIIGPHEAARYFPLVGTLFVFIFFSNFLGLIPGFLPPTDNLNTTLALGTVVFVYYNYIGFKEHGLSYLKHFFGPLWWLSWFMLPLELISHIVRPFSLALRLRGNIMGDHMVLSIFLEKTKVVVPVIFYGLGTFVCFIQAFVFCLLTLVYISMASSHDH